MYRVMKIFPQTMTERVNELINYGGDCRTAPATPGLLITNTFDFSSKKSKKINCRVFSDFSHGITQISKLSEAFSY